MSDPREPKEDLEEEEDEDLPEDTGDDEFEEETY